MKESKKEKAGNKEYDLKALDKSRTKARENFEHVKNTQELFEAKILDKPRTKVRGESWTSKNPKQTSAFKPRYTKGFFDFIILGGGGTGLAAAMYAARLGLKNLVLGFSHGSELPIGGVITTTNVVENYPGFIRLTGTELAEKIEKHARSYELVTIKEEKVEKVERKSGGFYVKTSNGAYLGKTILFATG